MKLTKNELGAVVTKEYWLNRYVVKVVKPTYAKLISFNGDELITKNDTDFLIIQYYEEEQASE